MPVFEFFLQGWKETGGFSVVAWKLLVQIACLVIKHNKEKPGVSEMLEECLTKLSSMLDKAGQKSIRMLCTKECLTVLAEEEEKKEEEQLATGGRGGGGPGKRRQGS